MRKQVYWGKITCLLLGAGGLDLVDSEIHFLLVPKFKTEEGPP